MSSTGIGTGIDVAEIDRFAASLERTPGLVKRLFRDSQLLLPNRERSARGVASLAVRFAANEALPKALVRGATHRRSPRRSGHRHHRPTPVGRRTGTRTGPQPLSRAVRPRTPTAASLHLAPTGPLPGRRRGGPGSFNGACAACLLHPRQSLTPRRRLHLTAGRVSTSLFRRCGRCPRGRATPRPPAATSSAPGGSTTDKPRGAPGRGAPQFLVSPGALSAPTPPPRTVSGVRRSRWRPVQPRWLYGRQPRSRRRTGRRCRAGAAYGAARPAPGMGQRAGSDLGSGRLPDQGRRTRLVAGVPTRPECRGARGRSGALPTAPHFSQLSQGER